MQTEKLRVNNRWNICLKSEIVPIIATPNLFIICQIYYFYEIVHYFLILFINDANKLIPSVYSAPSHLVRKFQ